MCTEKETVVWSMTTCILIWALIGDPDFARADLPDLPVVLTGADLPLWSGLDPDGLSVFVYEAIDASWHRIPHQIDERLTVSLATCLNDPSLGNVDDHLSYDFAGAEGNGLDDDDELVFMAQDAIGDQAPATAWPPGVDDLRYEVTIRDGGWTILGYCYLFSSASAPAPPHPADYVAYSFLPIDTILEDTDVTTNTYRVHYSARWRLDELAVRPGGGGSDVDLIDRFKRREATDANAFGGENEELWDQFSCFLGHKDGVVRAIREVQGAASGVNTTLTTIFYRNLFAERVNLRVHAIPNVVEFIDYNQAATTLTYYNPFNPLGIEIDGVIDPGLDLSLGNWEMVSHPTMGGCFYHRAEPIPIPAQSRSTFFFEDADFADSTGDDEPGRFGCHGIRLTNIASTDEPGNEAVLVLTFIPLQAGTGNEGAALALALENPTTADAQPQNRVPESGCPFVCGDIDGSGGSVDLVDFASFAFCFGGSPGASTACLCSDLNGDGVINLTDSATFSLTFGGVSTNVAPNCP